MDYVLKPFSSERVTRGTGHRRAAFSAAERAASLMQILPQMQTLMAKSTKMAIKVDGRILFIDPTEVVAVEAQGNYVLLQRPTGSYLLRGLISALAEKLKPYGFLRIHRSVIVNSACVQEIHPCDTGEYMLRTQGGQGIHRIADIQIESEEHRAILGGHGRADSRVEFFARASSSGDARNTIHRIKKAPRISRDAFFVFGTFARRGLERHGSLHLNQPRRSVATEERAKNARRRRNQRRGLTEQRARNIRDREPKFGWLKRLKNWNPIPSLPRSQ